MKVIIPYHLEGLLSRFYNTCSFSRYDELVYIYDGYIIFTNGITIIKASITQPNEPLNIPDGLYKIDEYVPKKMFIEPTTKEFPDWKEFFNKVYEKIKDKNTKILKLSFDSEERQMQELLAFAYSNNVIVNYKELLETVKLKLDIAYLIYRSKKPPMLYIKAEKLLFEQVTLCLHIKNKKRRSLWKS